MAARIVAIIQARMGASRLPGKVLLDIGGRPMLQWVIERASRARSLTQVLVATTVEAGDDPIADFCRARGWEVQRGSLHDVLDRYHQAARASAADVVVRITADCPLIDPALIDRTVQAFMGQLEPQDRVLGRRAGIVLPPAPGAFDFAANRLPPPFSRSYPIGLDVEVCSFAALDYAWRHAEQLYEREHVMPFLYAAPGRFSVLLVNHDHDFGTLRWTVDTPADLAFVRAVAARFDGRDDFSWLDVLRLVEREPQLQAINAGIQHKAMTDTDARAAGKQE